MLYSNSRVTNYTIPNSEVLFDGYVIAHKGYKNIIMLFTAVLYTSRIVYMDIFQVINSTFIRSCVYLCFEMTTPDAILFLGRKTDQDLQHVECTLSTDVLT